jgi:hypothetical protein
MLAAYGQQISAPEIQPMVVPVATASTVVVRARVSAAGRTLIPGSVTAIFDPTGLPRTLGTMRDDGIAPDSISGDGIFSGSFRVTYEVSRAVPIVVSAAFQGVLRRTGSAPSILTFAEAVGTIDQQGGIISVTNPGSGAYGVRLTIPPGALRSATTIGISLDSGPLSAGLELAGPSLSLSPPGLSFLQPALIDLWYSDSDNDGGRANA